ncbi:MAG: PhnD/SsuA/transferrin family substrate-binding protein [Ilumatobacter sp.]|uniref:phosphate/phosphite/phosphonate ABC transporter substrate-binding protein n=1 Tax=Ilumatobacter sp. TaxID=1967498 RepID=UPI0026211CBC|nr:PhnD/SsuA/transferrin family substrate-binding protein [Ilumatobacter sp.]MDJ0769087.1 PhnD/SsuA/transferrin family substrate-binding protein [Ilumatobacter sp.]
MRSRRFAGALIALSLVAAACGDDDDGDATEDTEAPAEDETETTEAPAEDETEDTEAPAEDETETTEAPAEDETETTEAPDTGVPEGWPESIVFGFVPSQEQEDLQDDIQPFIEVLEAGLGIDVEGVVTTDYTGLVTAMGSGQAQLGAFGPFGYVLGKDNFGNIEALIQSIRFGSATYHGQWYTNDPSICTEPPVAATALENQDGEIVQVAATDAVALQVGVFFGDAGPELGETTDDGAEISPGSSCIGSLDSVVGKTVAFTTETSTSGYLFPALELTEMGIDPDADITPVFAGGHDAAITAVYNGDADIGLSFDDARRTIRGEQPDVGEKLIVFSITDEIPNDVVAVSSDLPQDLKDAIYDTVSSFLETEEGEAIFDEIYGWTDVRRAEESDFDIVRTAANTLGITEPID